MVTPLPCCPICQQEVEYVGDALEGVTTVGDTDVFHCKECKMYIVLGEVNIDADGNPECDSVEVSGEVATSGNQDSETLRSSPDSTGDERELSVQTETSGEV